LGSGVVPPNPQELLGQERFQRLLSDLAADYDVILIDTPPGNVFADAQMVSAMTGAALMVARKHFTSAAALRQLTQNIQQAGGTVVGSVLNTF
jgi:protein-tyrosine kinase